MDESYYMRAVAGPYTLIILRIISRVDVGTIYISACLFERGERALLVRKTGECLLDEDIVSFEIKPPWCALEAVFRTSIRDIYR